jgi:hypothetical protein
MRAPQAIGEDKSRTEKIRKMRYGDIDAGDETRLTRRAIRESA